MIKLRDAARAALNTYAAMKEAQQQEPELGDDGMPLDVSAWIHWRDTIDKPAFARWSNAMDALAAELGEPDMSRHPYNFVPRCEELAA